jgi:hypothetical protein
MTHLRLALVIASLGLLNLELAACLSVAVAWIASPRVPKLDQVIYALVAMSNALVVMVWRSTTMTGAEALISALFAGCAVLLVGVLLKLAVAPRHPESITA